MPSTTIPDKLIELMNENIEEIHGNIKLQQLSSSITGVFTPKQLLSIVILMAVSKSLANDGLSLLRVNNDMIRIHTESQFADFYSQDFYDNLQRSKEAKKSSPKRRRSKPITIINSETKESKKSSKKPKTTSLALPSNENVSTDELEAIYTEEDFEELEAQLEPPERSLDLIPQGTTSSSLIIEPSVNIFLEEEPFLCQLFRKGAEKFRKKLEKEKKGKKAVKPYEEMTLSFSAEQTLTYGEVYDLPLKLYLMSKSLTQIDTVKRVVEKLSSVSLLSFYRTFTELANKIEDEKKLSSSDSNEEVWKCLKSLYALKGEDFNRKKLQKNKKCGFFISRLCTVFPEDFLVNHLLPYTGTSYLYTYSKTNLETTICWLQDHPEFREYIHKKVWNKD